MQSSTFKYLLVVSIVVATAAIKLTSANIEEASNGLMTITNNTTLTSDHTGQIKIDADNITLDCANHKISFTLDNTIGCGLTHTFRCGIRVENRSGITIKNCEVIGAYDFGVWIAGSTTPSLVENVTARSSVVGFRVEDSDKVTVRNCLATTCTDDGFDIRRSSNVSVIRFSAIDNVRGGIDVNDGSKVSVQQAQIQGNGSNGIEFDGSPDASLVNSTIRYNRMHGLSLDPSLLDPLKHPCIGSLITSNIIEFNTLDGIRMGNCDNGFIRSNTSQSNGRCNAYQGGGSTGNIWTGNILQNWCGTVPEQH